MYFDKISEILDIAKQTSSALFVVPKDTKLKFHPNFELRPDESSATRAITVEQMRNFIDFTNKKASKDQFCVIYEAEKMPEATQNIFLKTLEEPRENYHYLLLTDSPSELLPTILSRVQSYFLRTENNLDKAVEAPEKIYNLAKELIIAKPEDLPEIAEKITKHKDKTRVFAEEIVSVAIEILYKSYFKTSQKVYLQKISKFLNLYDNLKQNGHIKLHIVADLC